ncbi:hypothetical protein [Polyangium jinanense]|uniref:Uncharacterized protein n=1 Tax=Polyangium jinanense TaxID=2829994 RepID=A0A9X4AVY2_9BACT|nr:hypothetical protein [Polyangium jinanense]MDC3960433.1 hypothetical protein [Polyangium jinanense]MDC3986794.1 hypothetical protein [Polyangium jinanense]
MNNLLSLSTQLPEATASASALASAEAPPLVQGKAVAAKLNNLAGAERSEACHQKWWKSVDWTSLEAGDSAEHLSSAELLASVKAVQD